MIRNGVLSMAKKAFDDIGKFVDWVPVVGGTLSIINSMMDCLIIVCFRGGQRKTSMTVMRYVVQYEFELFNLSWDPEDPLYSCSWQDS